MDWLKEWTKSKSLRQSIFIYILLFLFIGITFAKVNTLFINNYEELKITKNIVKVEENVNGEIQTYYKFQEWKANKLISYVDFILFKYRDFAVEIHTFIFSLLGFSLFYKDKLKEPIDYLNFINPSNTNTVPPDADNELARACEDIEGYLQEIKQDKIQVWRQYDTLEHMIAALGHDIRTPITILKGYNEILTLYYKEGKLNAEKIEEILASMGTQIDRLDNYINKMSKLRDLKDIEIRKKAVDLEEFIMKCERVAELLAEDKRIHVTKNTKIKSVMIDGEHIFELFENVLNNALRYAKSEIAIEFKDTKDHLFIIVRDDGDGFSKEALIHGTTSFYSNDKEGEHLGLGLNISKEILDKHGGNLILRNTDMGAAVEIQINL